MSLYDLCTSKIGATADDYDTVLPGMMDVYCKHCGKRIMRTSIDNREKYTNHNYVCDDCWDSNEAAWTICSGDGIDEYLM
jgi:predicted RNA-binding Zn-ribbon protein involved in translation (DUF1610 family)